MTVSVETVIYDRLKTYAGLTTLIGINPNARVYLNVLPQNVSYPAISWRRVTSRRTSLMSQDSNIVQSRFQFDVWAETWLAMHGVSEQLKQALKRWSTETGVVIQDITLDNQTDVYEDSVKLHHGIMDFLVYYEE